jgi:hypothetical protein
MDGTRTKHDKKENSYKLLAGSTEQNKYLERLRHRWEVNIQLDVMKD